MKASEIRGGKVDDLMLVAVGEKPEEREALLREVAGDILLIQGELITPIKGWVEGAQDRLVEVVGSNLPYVAYIIKVKSDYFNMRIHRFSRFIPMEGDLIIRVDESIRDDLKTRFGRGGSVREAVSYLEDQLLMGPAPTAPPGQRRAVFSGGEILSQQAGPGFRLYAAQFAVDVRHSPDGYHITRLVKGARIDQASLSLLIGSIQIADVSAERVKQMRQVDETNSELN